MTECMLVSATQVLHLNEVGMNRRATAEEAVSAFLKVAEADVQRWIQLPRGLLLFVMVPGDPESGAFYVFDRVSGTFYLLTFEDDGNYGGYSLEEYDRILRGYRLLALVERPWLLAAARDNRRWLVSTDRPAELI